MKRPNIALIILDTARAANFSCYGYERETTPEIDKIASEGVLFENAISPSPWTLPAHASIFTGLHPSFHGCTERHKRLDPLVPTLPKMLKDSGYHTAGFSNNSWISRAFGFANGFDAFYNLWQVVQYETDFANPDLQGTEKYGNALGLLNKGNPFVNLINGIYGNSLWRRYDYGARRINRLAAKALERMDKRRPFFIFINYLEPHLKYAAPEPWFGKFLDKGTSRKKALGVNQDAWACMGGTARMTAEDFEILRALYDAELSYLDYRVGEFCRALRKKGLFDDTVLIITSDHGENLGEHGLMDHQFSLHDTLLRVPLIIRFPGIFNRGARIKKMVQTTGILPTVCRLLGIENKGKDLLQLDSREAFAEYLTPQPPSEILKKRYPGGDFSRFCRGLTAVYSGDWKLISSTRGEYELYNLKEDPEETSNLFESRPAIFDALRDRLKGFQDSRPIVSGQTGEVAAGEVKKRLEALGYLT